MAARKNPDLRLVRVADVCLGTGFLLLSLPVTMGAVVALRLSGVSPLLEPVDIGVNGLAGHRAYRFRCRTPGGVPAVGRWMHHLRIDEIPLVVNVLTGDMSFFADDRDRRPFAS